MSFIDIVREEREREEALLEEYYKKADGFQGLKGLTVNAKQSGGNRYFTILGTQRESSGARYVRYIGKRKSPMVEDIQTYRFLRAAIKRIEKNVRLMKRLEKGFGDVDPNVIQEKWGIAYNPLPDRCFELSGQVNRKAWREKYRKIYHVGIYSHPEGLKQRTKDGNWVRSKSEQIIYNMLYDNALAFAYEMPFWLDGNRVEPDFCILSEKTGRLVIWEHFGLLNKGDYIQQAQRKMRLYHRTGYRVGSDLIITYDRDDFSIDSEECNQLMLEYLVASSPGGKDQQVRVNNEK